MGPGGYFKPSSQVSSAAQPLSSSLTESGGEFEFSLSPILKTGGQECDLNVVSCEKRSSHIPIEEVVDLGRKFRFCLSNGIYIAFATALCSGKDPTDIDFIQHKLRSHLKNCLMQNSITEFPQMLRKRVKGKKKEATEDYEIHCVCRQPDGGSMIQCDACNEWFHDACIETNTRVWKNLDSVWLCITCS